MKKTYFIADTHFGHKNIIRYSNRPFASVREMDETLIENWNNKVSKDSTVYHLGDFCFGRTYEDTIRYSSRLNGTIHLIKGNHDKHRQFTHHTFDSIRDIAEINVYGQKITLYHYACRTWNCSHHGAWMLYGHSHGSLQDDPNALSFDVGVDCHNYTPLSFDDVADIMATKKFVSVDHHN